MLKPKNELNIGVIVQARMGSTRLPEKILKNLDNSHTVIDLLIKRLKLSKLNKIIIIATTPDIRNKVIIDRAKFHNVNFFIGSEVNVLERYFEAAKEYNLDIIIRVTSDCPFVDPTILDNMISLFLSKKYDYIKNIDDSTNFPRGFDIEVFSIGVLEKVYNLAETKSEKEHVTYYIYTHPEKFSVFYYNLENLKKINGLRLTIDEEEDLFICREVYKRLIKIGKDINFSIFDIITIIEKEPHLMDINKNIVHKKIA